MTPRDIALRVPDGRSLGVRLAGAEQGPLVVYMHGSPSSRLDIDYMHERSAARGVRLAAMDRPGYGKSDPYPFTFASVAQDLGAVADQLGATQFAVVGQSSGTGHALAVAAYLPQQVTAVATNGGGKPFEPGTPDWERLSEGEQRGVLLVGVDDAEAERLLSEPDQESINPQLAMTDDQIEEFWMSHSPAADQRVLRAMEEAGFGHLLPQTIREAVRHGYAGWARDNVVRMPRWDSDLSAIRCPATFWIGDQDKGNVAGAKWLKQQVPHGELRLLPDHGHFLAFELWDEVLDSVGV
jgi:pimeloyl-ACP methyl ester carboxylesterase